MLLEMWGRASHTSGRTCGRKVRHGKYSCSVDFREFRGPRLLPRRAASSRAGLSLRRLSRGQVGEASVSSPEARIAADLFASCLTAAQCVNRMESAVRERCPPSGDYSQCKLNVGGSTFTTTFGTLRAEEDSMLAKKFTERWFEEPDCEGGCYFIDRDPRHFGIILNCARSATSLRLCLMSSRPAA